jgi:hypothetical protein
MVQTLLGLALFFMAGYMLFSGRETESVVLTADEQWRLQVLHFLPRAADVCNTSTEILNPIPKR